MANLRSFDGTDLYWEEEAGDGTPVLLLHGLSASIKGNWRDPGIWDRLAKDDHRVIGLDARGHGRSAKPHDPAAYENGAMEKDVAALLDHLDLGEFDLIGYSMGAGTALRFAPGDARLRRLVLGGIGGDPKKWGIAQSGPRVDLPRRWLAGLEADDPASIEDPVARGARKLFEARGNDLKAAAAFLRSSHQHLSADTDLESVKVPTLVVCGDHDVSPHELAAALPDGRAQVLKGDHEGVVVNPELAEAIAAFLA